MASYYHANVTAEIGECLLLECRVYFTKDGEYESMDVEIDGEEHSIEQFEDVYVKSWGEIVPLQTKIIREARDSEWHEPDFNDGPDYEEDDDKYCEEEEEVA
jgi:hypothetical protein